MKLQIEQQTLEGAMHRSQHYSWMNSNSTVLHQFLGPPWLLLFCCGQCNPIGFIHNGHKIVSFFRLQTG